MSDAFFQPQPGGSVKKVAVYRNEVLLSQGHHPEPPIPDTILTKWQNIVDLMAEMLDVPAALITRIVGEEIHVFVSSGTEGNPYRRGDSQHFWNSGLYCETVVTKNHELLIPNALLDEAWRNNPQVRLNLISYLGYLIRWPDGTPFGTMCVFDCKTNSYSEKYKRLIIQFRDIVEIHLEIIYTEAQRREELERLVDERTASLQLAVAQQIEANNRVRRLVDANIIGIFLWNFEGQITEANEAFLQMLNYSREDLVSGRLNWRNLTPPEWRDLTDQSVTQLKATGTLQPYEKEYFCMDGTRVPVLVGSAVFEKGQNEGVSFVIDLSERKRAEHERKQAEEAVRKVQAELAHLTRVATMGELTASIAHEVNQPLTAAANSASACLRWLEANELEEARQSNSRVIASVRRASEIIAGIRALAKKAPLQKEPLDLNETINEAIAMVRSELHTNNVSLQTQLANDLPLIKGDRVQLEQVILNLIINASEAMAKIEGGPRILTVSSERSADISGNSEHVTIAVRDSGPGLDMTSLDRLFDTFYTTKPQGLGMGLAISRSIIEAHGGRLWAENAVRGAVFQFALPLSVEASEQ